MRYDAKCDSCGAIEEITMHHTLYSEDRFPLCPNCWTKMRRAWTNSARLDHQSKGRFGFVTNNMGDGPQYVHDYGDLQKKLKARGLHLAESDRETEYYVKHMREADGKVEQ